MSLTMHSALMWYCLLKEKSYEITPSRHIRSYYTQYMNGLPSKVDMPIIRIDLFSQHHLIAGLKAINLRLANHQSDPIIHRDDQ